MSGAIPGDPPTAVVPPPSAVQTGAPRRVIAADNSTKTLASIGPDGRVEWRLAVGAIHDLHRLPDGHLLYQDGWMRIVEFDVPLFDRPRMRGHEPEAFGDQVYSAVRLDDGNTLIGTGNTIAREALYWEHEGNRAIRVGDWKLVASHGQPWELYDVSRDRSEQHDLSGEQPERVSRMAAMWEAYAARTGVAPWGEVNRKQR